MEITRIEALEILKENKIEIDIKESRSPEELATRLIILGSTAIQHEADLLKICDLLDSDTNQ
jgi:hypothetical protein